MLKSFQPVRAMPRRANRQRLTPVERPAILGEIDKTAADVRMNMERLREPRLAKEAQEVRQRS
jgi:hypothetical protein